MKRTVTSDKWRVTSEKSKWRVVSGEWRALSMLVLGALFLPALNGCSRRTADAQDNSTSFGSAEAKADKAQLFTVPENQMQHVSVVTVEPTKLPRVLRLSGSVAYNNFETTPVITQAGGPVARILVSPGEYVRAGQPLLYVSSPDYAQTRTTYLKAKDALALAEKNYTRAQDLYAHHAIAEADLQQAESTRNQAQADLQAAEQAVKVLGIPNPESLVSGPGSAEIPVLAPIAGEIVERLVGPGQVIQAGATQCFTISNMGTVWVMANVYEKDLSYVHNGDAVTIQTDAYPTTFSGRISYVGAALDPTSRTLQVRIVTNNPGSKLKKDMYVTALVHAGANTDALTVPDSAVLRNDENQPFVYAAAGSNQFGQRLVTLGESEDGKTQILSGLQAGDRVAADGSLFLQFANSFQK
ncbi:MAG TPA: efflux RND transporter periplasmic adaptor subunit [Terriglobia bacterium]|nr:efflux RND transporter periplasmic adaptor subunit [Terriglobia bacterium]